MKQCSDTTCLRQVKARGLCSRHYYAWRKSYEGELQPGNTRHGMRHSPEYETWCSMKGRCFNKNSPDYPDYGGRGIVVCDEWRNDFKAFYEYIGPKPQRYMSIDRVDVDGNYEPGNVRWATAKQQSANRRTFRNNQSGVEGIHWAKNTRKWTVRATIDGNRVVLGSFKDFDEAEKVLRLRTAAS